MASEWPHSVQDGTHSIQNRHPGPDLHIDDERAPLLHEGDSPCVRNIWITFFLFFLFVGFATGAYLLLNEEMQWPTSENYSLVTRRGWRAKDATTSDIPKLEVPVERILLTKTDSPECKDEAECSRKIHQVQRDHLERLREPDIGYNFLIAGDGQTYEGRGWSYQGMVSRSSDNRTLVVAFLGVFNDSSPPPQQVRQVKSFLEVAESRGKLAPCYEILEDQKSEESQGIFSSTITYLKQRFKRKPRQC